MYDHMDHAMRKRFFGYMLTVKAQISLRIRAVWPGPSLSAKRIIEYYRMYEWEEYYRMYEWRENDPVDTLRMRGMTLNQDISRTFEVAFSLDAEQLHWTIISYLSMKSSKW